MSYSQETRSPVAGGVFRNTSGLELPSYISILPTLQFSSLGSSFCLGDYLNWALPPFAPQPCVDLSEICLHFSDTPA